MQQHLGEDNQEEARGIPEAEWRKYLFLGVSNKLSGAADLSSKMRTDIFSNMKVISDLRVQETGVKKLFVKIHF